MGKEQKGPRCVSAGRMLLKSRIFPENTPSSLLLFGDDIVPFVVQNRGEITRWPTFHLYCGSCYAPQRIKKGTTIGPSLWDGPCSCCGKAM